MGVIVGNMGCSHNPPLSLTSTSSSYEEGGRLKELYVESYNSSMIFVWNYITVLWFLLFVIFPIDLYLKEYLLIFPNPIGSHKPKPRIIHWIREVPSGGGFNFGVIVNLESTMKVSFNFSIILQFFLCQCTSVSNFPINLRFSLYKSFVT